MTNATKAALEASLKKLLLKKPLEHHALTGLRRDQIPQVAHLGLPDAVDAAETLLQTVWIPRQVIVNHQVRSL